MVHFWKKIGILAKSTAARCFFLEKAKVVLPGWVLGFGGKMSGDGGRRSKGGLLKSHRFHGSLSPSKKVAFWKGKNLTPLFSGKIEVGEVLQFDQLILSIDGFSQPQLDVQPPGEEMQRLGEY